MPVVNETVRLTHTYSSQNAHNKKQSDNATLHTLNTKTKHQNHTILLDNMW